MVLVALATFTVFYPLNTQDATRLAADPVARRVRPLKIDRYHTLVLDRSYRRGNWYSDKAPACRFRLPLVARSTRRRVAGNNASLPIWLRNGQLWALRVLTSGLGLLLARCSSAVPPRGCDAATAPRSRLPSPSGRSRARSGRR